MKKLRLIISLMAVLHVLAIVALIGWLGLSDRLSAQRLQQVRDLFAETTAAANEAAPPEDKPEADKLDAVAVGAAPLDSAARIALLHQFEQVALRRSERVRTDTQILIETLQADREALRAEQAALQAERAAFAAMRREIQELEGNAQFAKAVEVYEGVAAEDARDMLAALIADGEKLQAVAYLNALPLRQVTKIVSTFEEQDAALAADLLESLRTFGLEAEAGSAVDGSGAGDATDTGDAAAAGGGGGG